MASTETLTRRSAELLDDLTRLSTRDIVDLWRLADTSDARATVALFLENTPAIISAYGDVAATLGADLYDELRDAAGAPGQYRALPAQLPSAGKAEAMTRWAVGPLFGDANFALALANLAGGTDRLIRLPFRDTIAENTRRDPASFGLYRYASPGCCNFCADLSGVVRYSDDEAESASGEWHMNCRCVPGPGFGPGDI